VGGARQGDGKEKKGKTGEHAEDGSFTSGLNW
jgi:hypothetical protein